MKHIHHVKKLYTKHKRHLKKKTIWLIEGSCIAFVVISFFGYVWYHGVHDGDYVEKVGVLERKTPQLSCDNGYTLAPTYYAPDGNRTLTKLSLLVTKEGAMSRLDMQLVQSAGGLQYETQNGIYTFWEGEGTYVFAIAKTNASMCTLFKNIHADADIRIKNGIYAIGNDIFTMENGKAEIEYLPGAGSKNILSLFGEPIYGDLDGDGNEDAALTLVNQPGGSGTFYYAVFALQQDDKTFKSTNAILLGDRIAPQTIAIKDGDVAYNYAVRSGDEPLSVPPSVGKTLWVHYDVQTKKAQELPENIGTILDPSKMFLGMKKWAWVKTEMENKKVITPKQSNAFTLSFDGHGDVSITTDCNNIRGTFTLQDTALTFSKFASTKMYCDGSQEDIFSMGLGDVTTYSFTSSGELILTFRNKKGSMVFK